MAGPGNAPQSTDDDCDKEDHMHVQALLDTVEAQAGARRPSPQGDGLVRSPPPGSDKSSYFG